MVLLTLLKRSKVLTAKLAGKVTSMLAQRMVKTNV